MDQIINSFNYIVNIRRQIMNSASYRVVMVSLIMVLSSLAGCIGDLEEEVETVVDDTSTAPLGTVIASTYHVQQLLSAVAGDTLNVELLSPSNVPVHDYSLYRNIRWT